MIRFTASPRLAGGAVILIGLLALAGWGFHIPALMTVLPGLIVAMAALAAWGAWAASRGPSEPQRAAEILRESEERLRLFIAAAPAAIAMFDRQMRYLAASGAWLREHGLSGEVAGRCHYDLLPWLPVKWKQAHQRALAGSIEGCEEDRWVRPDGSAAWAKWEVRPWPTPSGEVGGVVIFAEDITLRKVAEEALRASEQRLRLFIATAPAAIAMFDRRMCYVAASELWLKQHSLSGDVTGVCHYDAFPGMPPEWKQVHQRTLAGAVERCAEERWVRPDGSVAWAEWEMRPWLDAAGEVGGLVIFIQDITASKAAQAGLRESQEREHARRVELEALMAAAPMIVWIAHDAECRVITGNPAGEAMLRAPAGQNLSRTAPESERLQHFQVFQDGKPVPDQELSMQVAGRTGKPVLGVEQEIRYADGTSRWIYGNAVPMLRADGAVRGVVATFVDITERRRTEFTLANSTARFNAIISSAMDAVISIDEGHRVVLFNPAAERMFGVPAADALGKGVERFIPRESRAGHSAHVSGFGRTGVSTRHMGGLGAVKGLRSSGEEFPIEASISQVEIAGAKLFTVILRDITERTRAEADLQASRGQLRALAGRLQAVREEERSRLAREFHDVLAQDLTRLKLDIAWLDRRLAQPVQDRKLLHDKLTGMSELTDGAIGAVQRIATELRPVVLDSLGLAAAIEWQVKDFEERTGISCQIKLPGRELSFERARSTAIFRILQESLTNVARHAQASKVEVELRCEAEQLMLTVRDNGRGIRTADLSDVHSMGLLGMRERATLLGGHCEIATGAEGGTSVQVRVPLVLGEPETWR